MNGVEFYDRFAERYDRFYSGPGVKNEDMAWLSELRKLGEVVDCGEVVDVGCGTGALLDYVSDGSRYLGLDAAPGMVTVALRKHPGACFVTANMDRRINLGRRFDLAVCNFSFNYFQEPDTAMENLFRLLRPGGKLFLTLMKPKQVLMRSCSHRFDYRLVRFYEPWMFQSGGMFDVRGAKPFGLTPGYRRANFEDWITERVPWLANFEAVVCERT